MMADNNRRNGQLVTSDDPMKEPCTFKAGKVPGSPAPIRVSYFLVIMFVMQIIFQVQMQGPNMPWWWLLSYAVGSELILLLTIFIHEMGHGSMSKWLGGKIESILLWPFGGICFSSRNPAVRDARQKVWNELKIVVSGPATHLFQAPFWLLMLYFVCLSYKDEGVSAPADGNATRNLGYALLPPGLARVDIGPDRVQGFNLGANGRELGGALAKELMQFGVQINVILFLFNAFFPMYPMDSAKIIVCSLQLFGVKSYSAAWVLIILTIPCAIALLVVSFMGHGANVFAAVTGFMCVWCLLECWKIYKLISNRMLEKHYLFELAGQVDQANGVAGAGEYGNAGPTGTYGGQTDNYNNAAIRSRSNGNTLGGEKKFEAFNGQGFTLGGAGASKKSTSGSKIFKKSSSKDSTNSGYGTMKQGP